MEDDGEEKDETKRRTRNLSEKKRRDQFNMLVSQLNDMVSTNGRKLDKSSVLRSTIAYLKNLNELKVKSQADDVQEHLKPILLTNEELRYLVYEVLEGFLMVISYDGTILYISDRVTELLGLDPVYLTNKSIYDIVYEQDKPGLHKLLQKHLASLNSFSRTTAADKATIKLHLERGSVDGSTKRYELVSFNGHFRAIDDKDLRQHDINMNVNKKSNQPCTAFVCTGRLETPLLISDVSLIDINRMEFTSRHSIEWKYLFLDHRAPEIVGYMPFEVLGTSGYDYYHFEDLDKVIACHTSLMEKGEVMSCYYRFLTKGQQWIWLQSRSYITYHQWSAKPEFIVCNHRVVSNAEIGKCTKVEDVEMEDLTKVENNTLMLNDGTADDISIENISPTYLSERSGSFTNTFELQSQVVSSQHTEKVALSDTATVTASSTYIPEVAEVYATAFPPQQADPCLQSVRCGQSQAGASFVSEISGSICNTTNYRMISRAASMSSLGLGEASSVAWLRPARQHCNSESHSEPNLAFADSTNSMDRTRPKTKKKKLDHVVCYDHSNAMPQHGHNAMNPIAPQHGIGSQFLKPAAYVGAVGVVAPQNETQEQLQKKHVELQDLIQRQQEELRQVKEQLLLARLGIIQPLVHVPFGNIDEMQLQEITGPMRAQIAYPIATPAHLTHLPLQPIQQFYAAPYQIPQ